MNDMNTALLMAMGYGGASGGGGGGTTNYAALSNKPSINGITLTGNKTSEDLGITGGGDVDAALSNTSENPVQNKVIAGALETVSETLQEVSDALDGKQDKEDTGWKTASDATAVNYRKKNDIVYISAYGRLPKAITKVTWDVLTQLPTEYRPARGIFSACKCGDTIGYLQVSSTGNISLQSPVDLAESAFFSVNMSYPVGQ